MTDQVSPEPAQVTAELTCATWLVLSSVCFAQVSPSLRTVLQECMCCQCYARFGGHLPVPRADALLPYWVPLSLRPRKQVVKRLENVKDTPECSLESSSWHGCWRVCGDQHLLLKWQQLQALHQDELPGPQEDEPHAGRLGLLLPMSFNLLTLLQAVLRAILAIRLLASHAQDSERSAWGTVPSTCLSLGFLAICSGTEVETSATVKILSKNGSHNHGPQGRPTDQEGL
ncbi:hypothetical protein NN561_015204 [Cricetulus griseus]